MTPSDFNEHLLEAKDTALDTLEDLCAPAFPKRSRIPTTRDDGTLIPYEEQLAMSRAQPPRLNPDEQHVIVMERNMRVRAATTILKTRPIGEDGNPLPISPRHPQHHTRSRPRSTNPEQERAGSTDDTGATAATNDSPAPPSGRALTASRCPSAPEGDERSQTGTAPPQPADPPTETTDPSPALRAESNQPQQPTGSLAARRSPVANDARPPGEDTPNEAACSSTHSTLSPPQLTPPPIRNSPFAHPPPICVNLRSSAANPSSKNARGPTKPPGRESVLGSPRLSSEAHIPELPPLEPPRAPERERPLVPRLDVLRERAEPPPERLLEREPAREEA